MRKQDLERYFTESFEEPVPQDFGMEEEGLAPAEALEDRVDSYVGDDLDFTLDEDTDLLREDASAAFSKFYSNLTGKELDVPRIVRNFFSARGSVHPGSYRGTSNIRKQNRR